MLKRYSITYTRSRTEPGLPSRSPASAVPVLRAADRGAAGKRRIRLSLGGSVGLHLLLGGLILAAVHVRPEAPPDAAQAITMVFEPAPSPSEAAASAQVPPEPQAEAAQAAPALAVSPPPPPPTQEAPVPDAAPPPAAEPPAPPPKTQSEPMPTPPPEATLPAPAEPPPQEPASPPPREQPPPPRPRREVSPQPRRPRLHPAEAGRAALPSASAPAGPAPGPSAPTASAPTPAAQPTPGWDGLIAAWLASHKSYPEAARSRGEEGEVTVRFTVASDGRVLGVEIVRGSGSAALDDAARTLLGGARVPSPQVPETRTVRLRYHLE